MMSKELLVEKFMKPHRLHPAAIVFAFTSTVKDTILGFGVGLIFTLKESLLYFLIFVSIFLVILIVHSLLSWWRFTYHIDGDELRIEQGVFVRKKRYISKHRIHKIDLTANVIHRLFKLVSVQIDTASNSGDAEVNLSAIRFKEAAELRVILQTDKEEKEEVDEQEEIASIEEKMTWGRLFIAGSTSGSAGVIILAVLTIFSQIEDLIPRKAFNTAFDWVVNAGVVVLIISVILVLVLLWLFGIAGTMIRYGNFTIKKRENELFIKRGLLETKELTIPYERIQAIGIEQSPIRQPFGFVRVFAVVAGGSFDRHETFPVLFPMMYKREVTHFINTFLPEYDYEMFETLRRLPKRSLFFYVGKAFILPVSLLIPIVYFIPSFYWVSLILLFFTLSLALLQYKDLGYAANDDYFVFQKRRLQKVFMMTARRRIQSFEKSEHKLQRIQRVATIQLSLIGMQGLGTHYSLEHIANDDANELASWYSYRTERQPSYQE